MLILANLIDTLLGGADGGSIASKFHKMMAFIALLAYLFAIIKVVTAAFMIADGRKDEGKSALIGAFIAGGAGVICAYFWKVWGANPFSGL